MAVIKNTVLWVVVVSQSDVSSWEKDRVTSVVSWLVSWLLLNAVWNVLGYMETSEEAGGDQGGWKRSG